MFVHTLPRIERSEDMQSKHRVLCAVASISLVLAGWPAVASAGEEETITYLGVTRDQTDFAALGLGDAGYWFPQLDADEPVGERPTGENDRTERPSWTSDMHHFPQDPNFFLRTFSQDGPTRSAGGRPEWNTFVLPDGDASLSGAIVDPHAEDNSNNTVNRIQLDGNVPDAFYFHIVVDNTDGAHNAGLICARGNNDREDDDPVEADTCPAGDELRFNGVADVYTFRYDNFDSGDYLKLRLSAESGTGGPSIGGWMFDEDFTPGDS